MHQRWLSLAPPLTLRWLPLSTKSVHRSTLSRLTIVSTPSGSFQYTHFHPILIGMPYVLKLSTGSTGSMDIGIEHWSSSLPFGFLCESDCVPQTAIIVVSENCEPVRMRQHSHRLRTVHRKNPCVCDPPLKWLSYTRGAQTARLHQTYLCMECLELLKWRTTATIMFVTELVTGFPQVWSTQI